LQATRTAPPWAAVVKGDGSKAAAAIEGNMIAPEGFCLVGLDDSLALDTLQHKAHQHNNTLDLREAKY
jgi:hypothetical protein